MKLISFVVRISWNKKIGRKIIKRTKKDRIGIFTNKRKLREHTSPQRPFQFVTKLFLEENCRSHLLRLNMLYLEHHYSYGSINFTFSAESILEADATPTPKEEIGERRGKIPILLLTYVIFF